MGECVKGKLIGEAATLALAARLQPHIPKGSLVFLHGDLGVGKTTFVRGYFKAVGHTGPVKSPTFTLVEEYRIPNHPVVYHFDLYRLSHPLELEDMGIRDYLTTESICFMEWPERGYGVLPEPDLEISLSLSDADRWVEISGRLVSTVSGNDVPEAGD